MHEKPRNPKAQGYVKRVDQTIKRWLERKLYKTHSFRRIDAHKDVFAAYKRTCIEQDQSRHFHCFLGILGLSIL